MKPQEISLTFLSKLAFSICRSPFSSFPRFLWLTFLLCCFMIVVTIFVPEPTFHSLFLSQYAACERPAVHLDPLSVLEVPVQIKLQDTRLIVWQFAEVRKYNIIFHWSFKVSRKKVIIRRERYPIIKIKSFQEAFYDMNYMYSFSVYVHIIY